MPSSLTWVDYDSEARERSLRILALFQERESRDELGLGGIRDTFSDRFFPGTSTIQTRLRYMLIVPWVYRHLEEKRIHPSEFSEQARKLELRLMFPLLDNDDRAGVFGKAAGKGLKRLPSSVYWAGLGVWGIRIVGLSQDEYHRNIDRIYLARDKREALCKAEAGLRQETDLFAPPVRLSGITWHPRLPATPKGFPERLDLRLTNEEANFLLDCISNIKSEPNSLLKHLALKSQPVEANFPWEHPDYSNFLEEHKEHLAHARCFSEVMHGAAIIYNLMLADLSENRDLSEEHRARFHAWEKALDRSKLAKWNLDRLWELTDGGAHTITARTRSFVTEWVHLVLTSGVSLVDSRPAKNLIRIRESQLKQARSRFHNRRALDQWSGYSGLERFSYRWSTARVFLRDLFDGLNGVRDAQS